MILKNDGFWKALTIILLIIKPFEEVEKSLQQNKVYCSDFFLIRIYFHVMKINIEKNIKEYLISRVISRIQEVISTEYCLFVFIYFIDNRYKGILLSKLRCDVAQTALLHICWKLGIEEETAYGLKPVFNLFLQCPTVDQDPRIFWDNFSKCDVYSSTLKFVAIFCLHIVPHMRN